MKFVSLFSGIGGLDLGLERAGHECVLQVEIDEFCRRVLAKHWPDVRRISDVKDVTAADCEGADMIVGGFPCQPVSVAGKRLGLDDPRWLWPEFARIVRLVRPRYVLVENVPGLLAGRGMSAVVGDLAESGYDTEWDCIPAAAVGAPHLRYRVFIVAYASSQAGRRIGDGWRKEQSPGGEGAGNVPHADSERGRASAFRFYGNSGAPEPRNDGETGSVADSEGQRSELRAAEGERPGRSASSGDTLADAAGQRRSGSREPPDASNSTPSRERQAAQSLNGRLGRQWATEPNVGRVAHGVPARVDRLRALGNSVVPQVAELIGRRLMEVAR